MLSPELMTDIFILRENPYNIRNIRLFDSENPWSVRFGVDAIVFGASHLWQKVPTTIKNSSSPEIFKAKIKLYSCGNSPCNLRIFFLCIIYMIVCLSACLSICLSVCMYECMYVCNANYLFLKTVITYSNDTKGYGNFTAR